MTVLREFMTPAQLEGRSFARIETKTVELEVPSRVDRVLDNREDAITEAQLRLLFAIGFRFELSPALPANFFDRAFTALDLARTASTPAYNKSALDALEALKRELLKIREIVVLLTAIDDPARAAVETSTEIEPVYALVDRKGLAERLIKGAEGLLSRFPALTEELIEDAKGALTEARKKVEENRARSSAGKIARVLTADPKQRATDVLIDSIDLLRAAAIATLRKGYPSASAWLESPLEKRAKAKGESEKKSEKPGVTQ